MLIWGEGRFFFFLCLRKCRKGKLLNSFWLGGGMTVVGSDKLLFSEMGMDLWSFQTPDNGGNGFERLGRISLRPGRWEWGLNGGIGTGDGIVQSNTISLLCARACACACAPLSLFWLYLTLCAWAFWKWGFQPCLSGSKRLDVEAPQISYVPRDLTYVGREGAEGLG